MRFLVDCRRVIDQIPPGRRGMNVDLDDAGVRRDDKARESWIGRRRVALHQHADLEFGRGGLDGAHEIEIPIDRLERRHEDVQHAVTRLGADRRPHDPRRRLEPGRNAVLDSRVGVRGCRRRLLPERGSCGSRHRSRQRLARGEWILFVLLRTIGTVYPGQRVERQPEPHGGIAGNQVHPLAAQEPGPGSPPRLTRHPLQARAASRNPRSDRVPGKRPAAAGRVRARPRDAPRTGRRSPVICVPATGSTRRPHKPGARIRRSASDSAPAGEGRAPRLHRSTRLVTARRLRATGRSTRARRQRASSTPGPSAAVAHRGTTCPGRRE